MTIEINPDLYETGSRMAPLWSFELVIDQIQWSKRFFFYIWVSFYFLEIEKKRRKELHEKELFELQKIEEEEEIKKRKIIEKSVNSVLDVLERKKEELANKEVVLKELKLIHSNERKELEEEFISKQRVLEEKQKAETERIVADKTKLRTELAQLEQQLEDLMSKDTTSDSSNTLPCPECPVCLEMLMPPIRIMQVANKTTFLIFIKIWIFSVQMATWFVKSASQSQNLVAAQHADKVLLEEPQLWSSTLQHFSLRTFVHENYISIRHY